MQVCGNSTEICLVLVLKKTVVEIENYRGSPICVEFNNNREVKLTSRGKKAASLLSQGHPDGLVFGPV